jgi:fatty-acid peroxygenase
MFLSLLTRPADVQRLVDIFDREWQASIREWARLDRVTLHDAVRQILCRAVCLWAGVPLKASEVAARTRELAEMIDGAGSIGPRNWRGHMLRRRTERWTRQLVDYIRSGRRLVPRDSIASAIAWHFEPHGELMPADTAAVELINVLRPTIAVARFITFAALALHEHPAAAADLRSGDAVALERFVQEVRRFYPFFPAVGGRVKLEFTWRGHRFTKGTWVLLDLYGTNHDPRIWEQPEVFRPARFADAEPGPFAFIPQGGGHPLHGHRCPGEDIAVELTGAAVRRLLELDYDVPEQDLRIDMSSVPAKPASGFIMSGVRPAARSSGAARRGLPPRRSS